MDFATSIVLVVRMHLSGTVAMTVATSPSAARTDPSRGLLHLLLARIAGIKSPVDSRHLK
jgi:hypothetical protein